MTNSREIDLSSTAIGRKAKYESGCWEEWMWGGSLQKVSSDDVYYLVMQEAECEDGGGRHVNELGGWQKSGNGVWLLSSIESAVR